MGLAILIEVTGFTFMAFFISRLGATPVAGHQIAVNLVSLMFMMPLALAQRRRARWWRSASAPATRATHARRSAGTAWSSALAIATLMGGAVLPGCARACCALYTHDAGRSSPPRCRCWPG